MGFINTQYEEITRKVADMEQGRKILVESMAVLENKFKDQQLSTRNACIEIQNIPVKEKESRLDLHKIVSSIGITIGLHTATTDIRDLRRLPGKPGAIGQ